MHHINQQGQWCAGSPSLAEILPSLGNAGTNRVSPCITTFTEMEAVVMADAQSTMFKWSHSECVPNSTLSELD